MKGLTKILISMSIILIIIIESIDASGIIGLLLKLVKYGFSLFVLLVAVIQSYNFIIFNKKLKYLMEIKKMLIVLCIFAGISCIKIFQIRVFTYKTIEELMQIALPFCYAFFIVNFLKLNEIINLMKILLAISIIAYIYHTGINEFFNLSNYLNISMMESYSPFENSVFAEIASGLSTFFIYYRKKEPFSAVVSCLFVFFVFKRILFMSMLFLLFVDLLKLSDKELPKLCIYISKSMALATTLVFYYLFQKENADVFRNIFGFDSGEFTLGRVYRIWFPLDNFVSYGFGSTSRELGYNLELDLIKILMELGIIALIVFIWCYFDLCGNNLYCYVIIGTIMVNLLFASCLTSTSGWIIRLVCMAVIIYYEDEWKKTKSKFNKYKIVI